MFIQNKFHWLKSQYKTNWLFLSGVGFLIGGFVFGPALNNDTLSVNSGKLLILLKLEFIALGILLTISSILVFTKKFTLSRIRYLILIPIPVLLYLGFGFWYLWITDDAFITFRAVRNFLSGVGPVFNIGERVEVYTHPLWLGILAFWDFLTGEIEIVAAWLGLLFSVAGLFLGQWGAIRLFKEKKVFQKLAFIPFGSLIIVALPPFWEYASSGLETGLGFFWLGMAFFLLSQRHPEKSPGKIRISLVWLSLGPLIRPDFIIFSFGLILITYIIYPPKSFYSLFSFIVAAIFFPLGYQIFRMGYFASFFPNPALAKSAFSSYWSQGIIYLKDFIFPYKLYIPLALAGISLLLQIAYGFNKRRFQNLTIALTFIGLGLLYAFLIVRGGADFMHGRFLLPSVFALQLPLSCVALFQNTNYRRLGIPVFIGMVLWAGWCIGWGRIPYKGIGPHGIANEYRFYVKKARQSNPITLSDYWLAHKSKSEWIGLAHKVAKKGISYERIAKNFNGRKSLSVGPSFYVYIVGALADPIASRFLLQSRGRPGHEKSTPKTWKLARFKDLAGKYNTIEDLMNSQALINTKVTLAKIAIECSPVSDLLGAIHPPLSPSRFLRNIAVAWRTRNIKIPKSPSQAVLKFCSPIPDWIESLLSIDPRQKILILEENNNLSESRFKSTFINPDCYHHNDKLIFEFKPLTVHKSIFVHLFIKGYEGKNHNLCYRFSRGHSEKITLSLHNSHTTSSLSPATEKANWYIFNCDMRKELQHVFGKSARFLCLHKITLMGNSKYLLVKRFDLSRNS